jgi:3,4-dihydroxy 2-butanone 4-phosphate synthase
VIPRHLSGPDGPLTLTASELLWVRVVRPVFTGCIDEIGSIETAADGQLAVRAPGAAARVQPGGSLCVSGVRITVTHVTGEVVTARVTEETLRRSVLGDFGPGHRVNVEMPLAVGDRLDGHLVQGHTDAVGRVVRTDDEGVGLRIWIKPPERTIRLLAAKGQVAVDGVSLTVAELARDRFSVVVVPATREATTLGGLAAGHRVNLESDLAARAAARGHADAAGLVARAVQALPWAGHVSGRAGVDQALAQLAGGGGVVVWDPDRETEGDVVFAGARLRPESFVFLLTQCCGHPTVPCDREILDRLELGPIPGPGDRQGTRPHVPVDLAAGSGTGVSADERAATVRRLAHPDARPADFLRPGHVFPLAARPGLLAERAGHTEATVAACIAAGFPPVGVCCEVMNPDGTMAGAADLECAALRWGLPLVEIGDLRAWL